MNKENAEKVKSKEGGVAVGEFGLDFLKFWLRLVHMGTKQRAFCCEAKMNEPSQSCALHLRYT